MKKVLYLIIFFVFSNVVYSQTTAYTFVKELQNQGIDTICVYGNYCGFCLPFKCEELDSVYVFWQNQGKNFVKRMHLCYDFAIVEIDTITFWNTFFEYKEIIKTEEVKEFEYSTDTIKKRKKIIITTGGISVVDAGYQEYKMIINNDTTDFFAGTIEFQQVHNNLNNKIYTNLNYQHNNNLKGKIVFDEIKKLVIRLETERKFIIKTKD